MAFNEQGPTTGPMPPPRALRPHDFSRFDKLMEHLQEWRSDDHEDNKVLCRSHIIEIIEGVKALRSRVLDPLARSADTAVVLLQKDYPGEAASLNAHVRVARVALGHD